MDEFVTLKTFTYSHELTVIRGKLESEGIESVAQDELTAQVDPFYSNAIGGIKLKVRESDLVRAIQILEEAGYNMDEGGQPDMISTKFDEAASEINSVLSGSKKWQLAVTLVLAILLVAGAIYFATKAKHG